MKKLFAKLPDGKSVFHGELDRGIFTRRIPHRYMRFSDLSFCLNESVIQDLWNRNCQDLEFVWLKAEERVTYRIDFKYALTNCKVVKNEHGESNLRIPVDECRIISRVRTAPEGKGMPPLNRGEQGKAEQEHEEKEVQTSLF